MDEEDDDPALNVRRWSTDEVDARRRLDYWVGAVCEAFLEMDCSSREATSFDGRLTSVIHSELAFNQVVASTQDVFRTAEAIARGSHYPFYLITDSQSPWHLRQDGHVLHLRPGDVALVDSAHRYELHFPDAFALMSIQLPRQWLGRWLKEPESTLPRKVDRDRGWGHRCRRCACSSPASRCRSATTSRTCCPTTSVPCSAPRWSPRRPAAARAAAWSTTRCASCATGSTNVA